METLKYQLFVKFLKLYTQKSWKILKKAMLKKVKLIPGSAPWSGSILNLNGFFLGSWPTNLQNLLGNQFSSFCVKLKRNKQPQIKPQIMCQVFLNWQSCLRSNEVWQRPMQINIYTWVLFIMHKCIVIVPKHILYKNRTAFLFGSIGEHFGTFTILDRGEGLCASTARP